MHNPNNIDSSTHTPVELEGWISARPIKVAFFVEPSEHSALILDGIFADCYSRWGGRFSLIIPCKDGQIIPEYWPWLKSYDPDVIYSYVNLTTSSASEIQEQIAPGLYIQHPTIDESRSDIIAFKPDYGFSALSSLSSIFRINRHAASPHSPRIKIIDSWHTERPSRFLADNLGIYRTSAATGMFPNDARSTAELLTIVPDEIFHNPRYRVPRDIDRVANEDQAFFEFTAQRATCVSLLSTHFAPRLEVQDYRWSSSFSLVIGETFEDRLLFWNSRLLIPAWFDDNLCCLRITLNQLADTDFVSQLAQLINSRNRVNDGSRGQPQLQLRSASHNTNELADVLNILQKAKIWSATCPPKITSGGHVIPSIESLKYAREKISIVENFRGTESHSFRWKPPTARPPIVEPDHLKDAPPNQCFTTGLFAVDLSFEYERDAPVYVERNQWRLPKRWRLAGAFDVELKIRGPFQNIPQLSRTTRQGDLTIFTGINRAVVSVRVPILEHAIRYALCQDFAMSRSSSANSSWIQKKAQWIHQSSEAPHLVGTLRLAGGLIRAQRLLLHPFLREVFATLGGTPNLADADIRATADALTKRSSRRPIFDLRLVEERTALAALIVKAAQSIKAPKIYIAHDTLRQRWEAHRESFWQRNSDEMIESDEEAEEWKTVEQKTIEECLAEMRTRRMLFQGYPWTCGACQHRNWTDFRELKPSLSCDVCLTEAPLPVGIPWHFRANEFLIESLRSHSVLSLLWVLSALHDRARTSFMYIPPTCFGFDRSSGKPDAEADLIAIVDGQIILCEIKSAWRSLRTIHIEDFVNLAKRLRPDQAILAVMEDGNRFEDEIRNAEIALKSENITFELLTPKNYSIQDDPFLCH